MSFSKLKYVNEFGKSKGPYNHLKELYKTLLVSGGISEETIKCIKQSIDTISSIENTEKNATTRSRNNNAIRKLKNANRKAISELKAYTDTCINGMAESALNISSHLGHNSKTRKRRA